MEREVYFRFTVKATISPSFYNFNYIASLMKIIMLEKERSDQGITAVFPKTHIGAKPIESVVNELMALHELHKTLRTNLD